MAVDMFYHFEDWEDEQDVRNWKETDLDHPRHLLAEKRTVTVFDPRGYSRTIHATRGVVQLVGHGQEDLDSFP